MSSNGTLSEEEIQNPVLQDLLAPLLAQRDQFISEEADIELELTTKKEERKKIEKVLLAGGLIDKKPKKIKAKSTQDLIAPRLPGKPRNKKAAQAQERALTAIKDMKGEPFQVGMIVKRCGSDRRTVETVVGTLRGEDRLRLLGNRPQLERTYPGGRPAATFQEID